MRTAAGKLKPMIKPLVDACHVLSGYMPKSGQKKIRSFKFARCFVTHTQQG